MGQTTNQPAPPQANAVSSAVSLPAPQTSIAPIAAQSPQPSQSALQIDAPSLSTNHSDAVVNRVAGMFQSFGLFITCIVAVIGVGAGVFGFLAYKSVRDFLKDWEKRLEIKECELKDALVRARVAEEAARGSAEKAATCCREIESTQAVVDGMLKNIDKISAKLPTAHMPSGMDESSSPLIELKPGNEPTDTVTPKEEADVAERLKGKLPVKTAEGGHE